MEKKWSELSTALKPPNLKDRESVLQGMGKIVIDEVISMIAREEQPDGSPQKQNSDAYRELKQRKKGYTTPLWGIEGGAVSIARGQQRQRKGLKTGKSSGIVSPYLGRKTGVAWIRQFVSPDTLHIYLNTKRWEIGYELQQKGYWFMGITDQAYRLLARRASAWFRNVKRRMTGQGFD